MPVAIPLIDGTDPHTGNRQGAGNMKKSTKQTSQHHKLALRRETIASLTLPQLSHVAGAVNIPAASQLKGCTFDTIAPL